MHPNRRQLLAGLAGLALAGVALADPVPEPKGLYTDAEAEAFLKELTRTDVTYPNDFHEVLKKLKIDVTRLGKVVHFPGNATDWYVYQLSPGYEVVGTQRLQLEKPEPKGIRVDNVEIRKRQK